MPGPNTSTPLVINAALTGIVPRRSDCPHVPLTPEEIGADALRCWAAGARIFHLHVRGSDEGPVWERDAYAKAIRAVKARVPEALICVSTSGRVHRDFGQRSDVLLLDGDVHPDFASLTLGSMNFPGQASVNDPDMIRRLADTMSERQIVPELEVFDFGMVDYAHYLIDRGILRPPYVFNLLLGSLGTLAATPANLALLVERLPRGAIWNAAGIGRFQWPMNALGIVMGGHVRTGLEDNSYLDTARRELATNEQLVARVAGLAAAAGRSVATSDEARTLLGLVPVRL